MIIHWNLPPINNNSTTTATTTTNNSESKCSNLLRAKGPEQKY